MFEDLDIDLLEKYFLEVFPDSLVNEEVYHILLLVLGEKPGVLLMNVKRSDIKMIREFCNDFDLEIKVTGDDISILDKLLGRVPAVDNTNIYLAEDEERFDLLKGSKEGYGRFTDRSIGEFLGYPEDSLKYYESEEIPGKFFQEKADFTGFEDSDLEYLELVSYVPDPDPESVSRAIDLGKRREELLRSLDNELGIEVGENYLSELKEE